jgi:hypothetical protein
MLDLISSIINKQYQSFLTLLNVSRCITSDYFTFVNSSCHNIHYITNIVLHIQDFLFVISLQLLDVLKRKEISLAHKT